MTEVEVPVSFIHSPTIDEVSDVLEEHGQMRLSELREEVSSDRDLGNALLEIVKRGDAKIFPNGEAVMVKPIK